MPHFSHHLTHHLSLIELRHFPIDISLSLAGIEDRSAAGVEQAEEPLQCTSDAAAASLYFLSFLYVERRPPRPRQTTG